MDEQIPAVSLIHSVGTFGNSFSEGLVSDGGCQCTPLFISAAFAMSVLCAFLFLLFHVTQEKSSFR